MMTADELDTASKRALFKEGVMVGLKSGGPRMTIEQTRTDGIIAVAWFVGAELHRDAFHPLALVLAD